MGERFTKQSARQGLRDYFLAKSEFRARKAEQYPHDGRNRLSAESLRLVAGYCMTLNDDDDNLVSLFSCSFCWAPEGVFSEPVIDGEGISGQLAIRCGFDGEIEPAEYFADWVEAVKWDYPKYARRLSEYGGCEPPDDVELFEGN